MHLMTMYHDVRQYADRLESATLLKQPQCPEQLLREHVAVYDSYGDATGHIASLDVVHRLGLIHRTADVLLLRSDGQLLLQRRAASDGAFPRRYSCSAGGHVIPGEAPAQTALRELAEELGLVIRDPSRVAPLHKESRGLPICWLQYRCRCAAGTLVATRHRLDGAFVVDEPCTLSERRIATCMRMLNRALPWDPPSRLGHDMAVASVFFNQEWTFYFAIEITDAEIAAIAPNHSEVQDTAWVSCAEAERLAAQPEHTTDSLECMRICGVWTNLARHLAARAKP